MPIDIDPQAAGGGVEELIGGRTDKDRWMDALLDLMNG